MKNKKPIGLVCAGAMLCSQVITAQIPVPALPVIDNAHILETIANGATLVSQLNQLVTTYNRITQQYNQAIYMAKYLANLNSYRMTLTAWQGMSATNTSGTTGGWLGAVNSGLNVSGSFLNSTYGRPPYALLSGLQPAVQSARTQMQYGTLELRDGTAESAMQTIGSLRLHGSQSEAALGKLETDSADSSADSNTTAALLNKINAAGMVNARITSDTNKALVTQAELLLIEQKQRHDAEAAMVEDQIAFQTTGMTALRAQHANFSNVLMTFEMP